MVSDLLQQAASDAMETEDAKDAKAGGKGGGWLRALARALGEAADKAAGLDVRREQVFFIEAPAAAAGGD